MRLHKCLVRSCLGDVGGLNEVRAVIAGRSMMEMILFTRFLFETSVSYRLKTS